MKTLNLTNDQLTLISEQNPEWVAYNRPEWMTLNDDTVPTKIENLLK